MTIPQHRPRRAHAFTLIEVLVVVGVIALLLGLLLPSLASSRESARAAACLSNLRQLLIANDLYATDFGDAYAPGMPDRQANLTRWFGSRESPGARFSGSGGPLSGYLDTPGESGRGIRACPSFAPALAQLDAAGAGFERGGGGYGYNTAFVGAVRARAVSGEWALVTDRAGMPRARFVDPARTCGFADSALRDAASPAAAGVVEYSFLEPRFWPAFPGSRPDPSTHFRHTRRSAPGATNIAWLDGHIAPERMTFSQASGFYPGDPRDAAIGWFGASDDNSLFDPD